MNLRLYNPVFGNTARCVGISSTASVAEVLGGLQKPGDLFVRYGVGTGLVASPAEQLQGMVRFHADLTTGVPNGKKGLLDAAFLPLFQLGQESVQSDQSIISTVLFNNLRRDYVGMVRDSIVQMVLARTPRASHLSTAADLCDGLETITSMGLPLLGAGRCSWGDFLRRSPREICNAYDPYFLLHGLRQIKGGWTDASLSPTLDRMVIARAAQVKDLFFREYFTRINPEYTLELGQFVHEPSVTSFDAAMNSLGFGIKALPAGAEVGTGLVVGVRSMERATVASGNQVRVFYTNDEVDVSAGVAAARITNIVALLGPLTFEIGYLDGASRVMASLTTNRRPFINAYPHNLLPPAGERSKTLDHIVNVGGDDPLAAAVMLRLPSAQERCSLLDCPVGYSMERRSRLVGMPADGYFRNAGAQAVRALMQRVLGDFAAQPFRETFATALQSTGHATVHADRLAGLPATYGDAFERIIIADAWWINANPLRDAAMKTSRPIRQDMYRAAIDNVFLQRIVGRGHPYAKKPSPARQKAWHRMLLPNALLPRMLRGEADGLHNLRFTMPYEHNRAGRDNLWRPLRDSSRIGVLPSPVLPDVTHDLHLIRYTSPPVRVNAVDIAREGSMLLDRFDRAIHSLEDVFGLAHSAPLQGRVTAGLLNP